MLYKLRNIRNKSDFGLVVDWKFHSQNKWVSAFTKYLVNAVIDEFNPIIISSQTDYILHKRRIKYLLSMEPGWAAPRIKYDIKQTCKKAVFYSDPHFKPTERTEYFNRNHFDYVYSFYREPFFRHFTNFPENKFIHFPWAVPDQFIGKSDIVIRKPSKAVIFGAKNSKAYDMRNWCRQQEGVTDFNNSGVENKSMTDEEYYLWLASFDAIIAAGSTNSKYDLVTPKYFEIMGSGALLIGQYCRDFEYLSFNNSNMLIFNTQDEFLETIKRYKENPEGYINIRRNGRNYVRKYHTISRRIELIRKTLYGDL